MLGKCRKGCSQSILLQVRSCHPVGRSGRKRLVCRVDPLAAAIKAFKSEEWECVWKERECIYNRLWMQINKPSLTSIQSDLHTSRCGCSVAKSCPTLCDPVDCSTPGLPVHHQLPDLGQTHVHWVGDAVQPSHPLSSFSPCTPSFPASGSFPMSWHCASGGKSIGASASASVLPMNLQGCFPLGLTGLIYLQFKGLSRVFTSTTVQSHQGS